MSLFCNYTFLSTFISVRFLFVFILFFNLIALGDSDSALNKDHSLIIHDLENLRSASIGELLPEGDTMTQSLINSPIPKLKNSKLGQILSRYYDRCLGGADHWDSIKSTKLSANLNTLSGIYQYESITKKPNLYKISLSLEGQTNVIAFDGTHAWQKQTSEDTDESVSGTQSAENLDRIVNKTELARYLLYPFKKDKAYQYLGTNREFNTVCFKIRVYTDQDFIIDYFIDVQSYLIVTIQVLDQLKKYSPVVLRYFDYRKVDGIYFAHKIEAFIDGQWDSLMDVQSIATNVGAVSWMFDLREENK